MQGKVVLVTGGSSGIGLAAAHKFAEAGAITVIVGREQDKLDAAKKEIDAALGKEATQQGGKVVTLLGRPRRPAKAATRWSRG